MMPTDAKARKNLPVFTGAVMYFPDALLAVAEVSRIGNDQHNPGEPLHWARGKSMDQLDSALRHMIDSRKVNLDVDGGWHLAKAAWRILAQLQLDIEASRQSSASVATPPTPAMTYAEFAAMLERPVGPIGRRPDPYGCSDGTDF